MLKVMFTGGGTAGHVTPNIALLEACEQKSWPVVYVGSYHGIERTLVERHNVRFLAISSGKLRRYFSWENFIDPLRILLGILQSIAICLREKPDVVFSKGGFVSVPVVVAAWFCRIPVVSHESDVTPGLANKLCFPFCRKVCITFAETAQYLPREKVVLTGTPLRNDLRGGDSAKGLEHCGFDEGKPLLLIFGGSLGALAINRVIDAVRVPLTTRFNVLQVVGRGNLATEELPPGFRQREFLYSEFGDVLAAASFVLARAGANSVYELLAARKPHLLIPLPGKASRGDQIVNARTFTDKGFSRMLAEEDLTAENLLAAIDQLVADRKVIEEKLATFEVPDSVTRIMTLLQEVASVQKLA